jgi:hypothetical protein
MYVFEIFSPIQQHTIQNVRQQMKKATRKPSSTLHSLNYYCIYLYFDLSGYNFLFDKT